MNKEQRMNRIRVVSQILKYGCVVIFGLVSLGIIVGLIKPSVVKLESKIPFRAEFMWMIWPTIIICIIYFLIGISFFYCLFDNFQKGQIFVLRSVRFVKWIGYWLIAGWMGSIVGDILSLFLSSKESIQITVGHVDSSLIGGLLVFLISWIMEEGLKLKEEQELTV